MKKSKIILPASLILILVLIFVGSIFLKQEVENDINNVEKITVNYSEPRLFNYITAPRGVKKVILVKLQENNNFEIITGADELSEEEKASIIADVKKLATKYINKIDGNIVEVVSTGYNGGKITITYDISNGNVKVLSIVQSESYDHNSNYNPENGDPFDVFEEKINSGNSFDDVNISGATVSSNGIKENYQLIQEYLKYIKGE